jgi:hypothetical protein
MEKRKTLPLPEPNPGHAAHIPEVSWLIQFRGFNEFGR